MDFYKHTKEELLAIYKDACNAYEAGDPIMSDDEYDALVGYLGIENDAEIGAQSKSKSYTVKHSFIMGSLDKVHTMKLDDDSFDFQSVLKKVNMHISKANNAQYAVFTPKYDGCSFSVEIKKTPSGVYDINGLTAATRGDGAFGSDITMHFTQSRAFREQWTDVFKAAEKLCDDTYDMLVIRGEALVSKDVYNEKYADKFKNTRVFVSGLLNRQWVDDDDFISMVNDISYVCYDYRVVNSKTSEYVELDWADNNDMGMLMIAPFNIGERHSEDVDIVSVDLLNESVLSNIYNKFDALRKNGMYQLDGIVVKPNVSARLKNNSRVRPADMIAIKFYAEKMMSTIADIEWSVSQNGECYPIGIIEPVYQDGKEIKRVSLHGYSYLVTNHVGIGSLVSIVMNGDIVPGVDSVFSEGTMKMPDFETEIVSNDKGGVQHLMKIFTEDELTCHKFCMSVKALVIDGIAVKTAKKIWDAVADTYENETGVALDNIMYLMNDSSQLIRRCMGEGKSIDNIITSLSEYRKKMTLEDVIRGLCIYGCGHTVSKQCARVVSGLEYDMFGLNRDTYAWVFDDNSPEKAMLNKFITMLDIKMLEDDREETGSKIPIIMTGDPSECTDYATKKQWLAAHPEYVETSKWSECKILFTNDLNSTTGKMKKAEKYGVEVKQYYD